MHIPSTISIEELVCHESFQQYCLGSNIDAQLLWEDWLASNPARSKDFDEAKKLFYIVSAEQGNRLDQLNQLKAGIQQSESFRSILSAPSKAKTGIAVSRRLTLPVVYRLSGGIAAALLICALFYLFPIQPSQKHTALDYSKVQAEIISSDNSPRKTVVLADGSVITLRSNSSLKVLPGFNKSNREVWLSGEAFFDIQHDTLHPFIVHTLWTEIKVLGTIFNVQAYPGALSTETSLITGSVEVKLKNHSQETIFLKPNQKLINSIAYAGKQAVIEKPFEIQPLSDHLTLVSAPETAWVRGRLEIDDQPLSEIAQRLEEWHGIRVRFEDEAVKNYRYSGVFEDENVINTLKALQLSYPFDFTVAHNNIIISRQKDRIPAKSEHN
jgi:transmembrane sensor